MKICHYIITYFSSSVLASKLGWDIVAEKIDVMAMVFECY